MTSTEFADARCKCKSIIDLKWEVNVAKLKLAEAKQELKTAEESKKYARSCSAGQALSRS